MTRYYISRKFHFCQLLVLGYEPNMNSPSQTIPSYWKHWLILIGLTLLVALPGLVNLPVIDRDEARFAQASAQMAESGDLINIRFQDQARNKKPAGIYWLQTGAIKALGKSGERRIWVQRLPSVFGALLAVLATYWGAARMIGRRGAFLAAGLLAISALMVFEAHIAKTDAVLCGLAACCFAGLAHLRNGGEKISVWVFWLALGASIMIKGPVVLILVMLTLITLALWERRNGWMKKLLHWPAIVLFILIWLPWAITIWVATDGGFFVESLGKDFSGKIVSAQEKHPGPPGYYFGTIWITLWPTCLLLIPGFAFAIRAIRKNKGSDAIVVKAMRLCLAWILPYWALIEIMPTKLPHYTLPLFPALCVMVSVAALTLVSTNEFPISRRINAIIFLIVTTILISIILAASDYFGDFNALYYGVGIISGLSSIIAVFALWRGNIRLSLITMGLSAIILSVSTYQFILPGLSQFRTSDRLLALYENENIALRLKDETEIVSPDFTEPSLVYHFHGEVDVSGKTDLLDMKALKAGRVIFLDQLKPKAGPKLSLIQVKAKEQNICTTVTQPVKGFNYSKGNEVEIVLLRAIDCPIETLNTNEELVE